MARTFVAYAAPSGYGPNVVIASHIGSITYTISYSAIGDANVVGRVRYFKTASEKVTETLPNGASITTADVVANVEVDFKGILTGTTVNGTINP